jgi:hypothetical protein
MIKCGELAQMRYLRLLVGLAVLDCQRKCNILNRLKTGSRVDLKAHQKNCLHHLKQKTLIHCQDNLSNTSPRNNVTQKDLDEDGKYRRLTF